MTRDERLVLNVVELLAAVGKAGITPQNLATRVEDEKLSSVVQRLVELADRGESFKESVFARNVDWNAALSRKRTIT